MIEEELIRISNMDEHQILLKVRNLRKHKFMSTEDFVTICETVKQRLSIYGYKLESACCGTFRAEKI